MRSLYGTMFIFDGYFSITVSESILVVFDKVLVDEVEVEEVEGCSLSIWDFSNLTQLLLLKMGK